MSKPMSQIPGPEPHNNIWRVLKLFRSFNKDSLGVMQNNYETYGDMTLMEIMGDKQVIITNPDLFREVMVTKAQSFHKGADYKDKKAGLARFLGNGLIVSDGEFWKKQRKMVQPALHTSRIRAYAETMTDYTVDMLNKWDGQRELDIAHELMVVTMRIVARTLFDTDIANNTNTIAHTMEAVNATAGQMNVVPPWVPTPSELSARRAIQDLNEYVYSLITERRASGEDTGDLLSMLILSETDDGTRMTDEEVRDEAVGLFLAGHETTANALNWTFWLLAQHPEVEAKLHQELDTVLQGRVPTLEDLRQLPYTDKIIKEAMRWMPPVSAVGRQAIEDVQIGDYTIEAGTAVLLNFYSVHRDPQYWDDPLAFNPERFTDENSTDRHRYAYLPFGGGARVCIGSSFAMMEAQLLLATIAQRYTLSLKPDQEVLPVARITTYPQDGLPMLIRERQPARTPELA